MSGSKRVSQRSGVLTIREAEARRFFGVVVGEIFLEFFWSPHFAMTISSASSASAQAMAAMERSRASSTAAEVRRSSEQATAAQVQTKRAVQQAAAAPREENRISPDIRQITKREIRRESEENRSENIRRIGEQMAAKFREVARRSEGVRATGNRERESFSAVA